MKITETNIQSANHSGIRELRLMAQEIPGVINLAGDQSDFDPPEFIRKAVAKALDDGHAGNPPARGFKDLREAITAKLKAENDIDADPDHELLLTADTTPVIFNVCRHLIDAGDEVIMMDPGFNYDAHIKLLGGKTVRVPAYESNGFDVDPEDIHLSINDKTKLVIINTPANPTGAVFDKTLLREIAKIARERDLWVLSDEAFEHLIFNGNQHTSIGSLGGMKDRTISVYSLSSSYAMAGWEVGYVVAPDTVIDELAKMCGHMGCSVSAVVQHAALAAINHRRDFARKMLNEYEKRRALVHQSLNAIAGVSCSLPASTFYAFPNFTQLGLTSWNLARYMVREHKVALLPGSLFGSNGEGFLRLTFAIDPAKLEEAISRIKQGVGQLLHP